MRLAHVVASAATLTTLAVFSGCFSGCSEPIPQTAGGAFFLATTQPDPIACKHVGHTTQVGVVDSTQRGSVVIDGTDGIIVNCTVESVAGNMAAPYNVHATINASAKSGNSLEFLIPSISSSAKRDAPAAGSVSFADPKTAGNAYQGNCNFYFEHTNQIVDDGRIWVSFDCPALVSGMSTCPVTQGYAILENCLTEAAPVE